MTSSRKNRFSRWLRVAHRDAGFLLVGVSLVYALSGVFLNHMNGKDPAYRVINGQLQMEPALSREEVAARWNERADELPTLKRVLPLDEGSERLILDGGTGVYTRATGRVDHEQYQRNDFIYWINKLHYNKVKGWSPVADLFAVSLIFLALSGVLIVKGKRGVAGRGKWLLLAGILLPVIYVLCN
ncbi:MAG: PepSY-associated TM helix domain-containing protein [Odoribacteraceae bacterium]|jgi:hypothetical protein|nr:PepSY-associated TM helix domain-containing protein [Odoribacteraceae bacterium]